MKQRQSRSLAEYLKQTGRTQRDLAHELEIAESYVSMILSGERQPSLSLAVRIAEVTGVPIPSLLREVTA